MIHPDQDPIPEVPESWTLTCPGVRHGLIALGWVCVLAGIVGMFVPLMPGTLFLLVALWALSTSSERFHTWLYTHPRLGRPLRDWHVHRVIPIRVKIAAVATMGASLVFVTVFVAEDWLLPTALGALLTAVALYIVTRPHRITA